MNILSISVLAVVTVIICVMLKPKNAEISVMLGISCSVIILIGVLTQVSAIVTTINQIIASSGISIDYIVILLKSIGICLVTEFANLGARGKSLREIFLQRQLSAAVNLFSFCSASIF